MKKIALFKNKAQNALLAVEAMATAVMAPVIGHAGFSSVTVNQGALDGVDPFAIAGKGIGMILTVLQILGIGMLIFGIVSVAQSMQDNGNPDKRAQGFATIAVAAILIGLKFVLQAMGILA